MALQITREIDSYQYLFAGPFSGPVNLPSLTYLSLGVKGMKSHINAPRLVIYHEGGVPARDSFNISLPSLVEYGVFYPKAGDSDPAKLHLSFPNIKRLAIRADELVLISFFTSLANQPHLLPALQTISVRARHVSIYQGGEGVQKKIESLVLVRNEACAVNVVVYFETVPPFRIPIFLGLVGDLSINWSCTLLNHIPDTGSCSLTTPRIQGLACSHSFPKL